MSIRDLDSGTVEQIRARYLVGAEGARSIVRSTMGASFEGNPKVNRTLSTFMRCDRLRELNEGWRGWMFRLVGTERYHRFVAIDGASLWIHHLTLDIDEDIDTVDVASELASAIGEPTEFEVLGQVELVDEFEQPQNRPTFLVLDFDLSEPALMCNWDAGTCEIDSESVKLCFTGDPGQGAFIGCP